jgi:hypothetical protein
MSWMVRMFGWLSADANRASRTNRPQASGSRESSSETNLRATGAAEARILRFVQHAHAAGADPLDDAVVGNPLSD